MAQITIDVPEDTQRKAKMLNVELKILLAKILKERIDELDEVERYKTIISKSKATERDVEELSDEINTAMWEYHKKKYNL